MFHGITSDLLVLVMENDEDISSVVLLLNRTLDHLDPRPKKSLPEVFKCKCLDLLLVLGQSLTTTTRK